jgi:hypothetical protein
MRRCPEKLRIATIIGEMKEKRRACLRSRLEPSSPRSKVN